METKTRNKIIGYVVVFSSLMLTLFCWINIYDGHTWIAATARGFLGVDQCPHLYTNDLRLNNAFDWIVWVNYWIF